jgi:hypothetical protein
LTNWLQKASNTSQRRRNHALHDESEHRDPSSRGLGEREETRAQEDDDIRNKKKYK